MMSQDSFSFCWDNLTAKLRVNLKGNRLTELQISSLKGLTLVNNLDFSCNILQNVGKNAFEDIPFLQSICLRGNIIEQVPDGSFKAWHGMQTLLVVDLSCNPVTTRQDTYFYRLPSMIFLIVPRKISCCLCKMKDDVDDLCTTVRRQFPGPCNIKATWCENQEPWSRMQEQVLKVLERRKVDDSSLLTNVQGRTITNIKTSVLAQGPSSTAATFTISDFLKQLIEQKARQLLDMNGDDKGQLENLYPRARVPEASLPEKISEAEKKSLEVAVQNDSPAQLSDKSTDETSKESVDTSTPSRIGRGGRATAKATMSSRETHSIWQLHNEAQTRRKLPESVKPQRALFSPQRRQSAQPLPKGKLLDQLLKKIKPPVKNDPSELSGIDSETLLNDLSSHIMSLGTYLEPHRTSLSAPSQEDRYQQASHFKDEVNKQLMPLISSTPLRELMSHIIHILKKECMEPTTQMTCSEVSSRTGLLLKLISDRLPKNGTNMTTTSSRQLEKPSEEEASHGVAEDGFKKTLWAILVTVTMATIMAVTWMIGILFLRSVARRDLDGRVFRRWDAEDVENPRVDYFVRDTALLQDSFETVDETINTVTMGNLHIHQTLEEQPENILSRDTARPAS